MNNSTAYHSDTASLHDMMKEGTIDFGVIHKTLPLLACVWTTVVCILMSSFISKHISLTEGIFTLLKICYRVDAFCCMCRACLVYITVFGSAAFCERFGEVFLDGVIHVIRYSLICPLLLRFYLTFYQLFALRFSFYYDIEQVIRKWRIIAATVVGFILVLAIHCITSYFNVQHLHYFYRIITNVFAVIVILMYVGVVHMARMQAVETDAPIEVVGYSWFLTLLLLLIPLVLPALLTLSFALLHFTISQKIKVGIIVGCICNIIYPIVDVLTIQKLRQYLKKDLFDCVERLTISYESWIRQRNSNDNRRGQVAEL